MSAKKVRMSGFERREQLIAVARAIFAKNGYATTSVEEIAAKAKVSKPVVYEHFGGKEGLYAVIVDREVRALSAAISEPLSAHKHPLEIVETTAMTLLDYIESNTDGFRILMRDSPDSLSQGSYSSIIGDVAEQAEHLLASHFSRTGLPHQVAPLYAQMLVGLISQVGQWWLEERKLPKEVVGAHVVNLTWYGLSAMRPQPKLQDRPLGVTLTEANNNHNNEDDCTK